MRDDVFYVKLDIIHLKLRVSWKIRTVIQSPHLRVRGTPHSTQYTLHYLKHMLPQHCKTYNDVFLLINFYKSVSLARLSVSSLRMVQVGRNM